MTSENPENPVSQRLDAILLIALFLICFRLFFILWITGDGLSYFSYLRSIVVDGDLNFRNEFSYVETWGTGSINCGGELTATGYVGNCF